MEFYKTLLDSSLKGQAKNLLGSDLVVSSNFPFSEKDKKEIFSKLPKVKTYVEGVALNTMARSESRSRLFQVVKLSEGFPFYGGIVLDNGKKFPIEEKMPDRNSIWVYPEVLAQLQVGLGDGIKIGSKRFIVSRIIDKDSFKAIRFSGFLPRIYMSKNALEDAQINVAGSTARNTIHLLFNTEIGVEELEEIENDIEEKLGGQIRVLSPEDGSTRVSRIMELMAEFLSLVSLVSLFLSLVGLFYLYSGFLHKHRTDINVLVDLGMRRKEIFKFYLSHFFILLFSAYFVISSLLFFLGPIIGRFVQSRLNLPLNINYDLSLFVNGLLFIILASFAIAIPMLSISLRSDRRSIPSLAFKFLPLLTLTFILSHFVAQVKNIGLFFSMGVLLIISAIYFLVSNLLKKIDFVGFKESLIKSLALKSLIRTPKLSITICVSLFMATFLFSLIPQVSRSLSKSLELAKQDRPRLFLIDIQKNQVEDLKDFVTEKSLNLNNISPFVQARVVGLNGRKFENESEKDLELLNEDEMELRNRGVNISYRGGLYESEKLLKGKNFDGDYKSNDFSKEAQLSVEKRYASRRGIKLNDTLIFDVLGIEILARVINVRSVKWTDFLPNFFLILQNGVLNDAPQTFIGTISPGAYNANQVILNISDRFPNISVIDIEDVINQILALVKRVSRVLNNMAVFCIFIGIFMILIIINYQLNLRKPDILKLKIIGVPLKTIRKTFLYEFFVLSTTPVFSGLLASLIAAKIAAYFLFENRFEFSWQLLLFSMFFIPAFILFLVNLLIRSVLNSKESDLFSE